MNTDAGTTTDAGVAFERISPVFRCSICGNAHALGVSAKSAKKLWSGEKRWSFTICATCVMAIKIAEGGE